GWTKTHGFFTLMGGFMRVWGKMAGPVEVVLPYGSFGGLQLDKLDEFLPTTEAYIQDSSKRDAISKGLVLLQTMWFILQCLGHAIERLPITELEIATLAFTVLNLATYWFWWNKPANVHYPYTIREWPTEHDGEGLEGAGEAENGAKDYHKERNGFVQVAAWVKSGTKAAFLASFFDPVIDSEELRVLTFYAGYLGDREESLVAWISALITSVFGAIHCFAWLLQFPSHMQQLMWRVSAVTISSAPLLLVGVFLFRDEPIEGFLGAVLAFLITAISLLYVIARITLLVLAFTSLRSLPPGAFETVYWTTFIPHL
ncbi:hypothetical protein JAAARDRAFT_133767, partial [Jaapia argillacea MUCL 33604]